MLYTDFQLPLLYFRLKGKYIESSENNEWSIASVSVLEECIDSLDGKPATIAQAAKEAVAKATRELGIVK
jgi:hypothetical protein